MLAIAHPFQSLGKIILPFYIAFNIVAPFLNFRILRITENTFSRIYKLSRIDRITRFLIIERNTNYIYGSEPFFNLPLLALTFINKQR